MDGTSEQSNKTINQSLRYHVWQNQRGWVRALPRIRFNLMNTPNASTDFSPFQLCMGQLPHIIPPLLGTDLNNIPPEHVLSAKQIIQKLATDINKAKDNLLQAKVSMAHYANTHHGPEVKYEIGNWVMLSTLHR